MYCCISLFSLCSQAHKAQVIFRIIKASEMMVAPRISNALVCYSLPWSALVWMQDAGCRMQGDTGECKGLLTSSFAPFGRSGWYVRPASGQAQLK